MDQEIRFCTASDGVRISYATMGEGPPLVKAANYLTHLEYDRQSPVWRHWLYNNSINHIKCLRSVHLQFKFCLLY